MIVPPVSRRRRGAVGLLVAVLLTAGCAGSSTTAATGTGPSTSADSATSSSVTTTGGGATPDSSGQPGGATGSPAFLAQALSAAQQMSSVRGEITVQAGDAGAEKQVASGTFTGSQAGGRMQTLSSDLTIAAKNQDVTIKMLYVDGKAYVGGDALLKELKIDKPWLEITSQSDNPQIAALGQQLESMRQGVGAEQIEKMQQAMVSSTEIGPEDVDGTPTTHYQVVIDVRKSLEALGSAAPSIPAGADIPDTIPTDLWLDDQGRMIKTQVEQQASGQRLVTTVRALAYDEPIDITAPDPAEVSTG